MMQAYLNDPELKKTVLNEMAMHRKSDNLVKGQYWEDGKGCAVGCLLKSGNHEEYESRFGIPKSLAELEDSIFEGLPNEQAMLWPERFLSAFEVGRDYSKVWNHFAVWLLIDPDVGVIRYADERGKVAIMTVAKLHQQEIDGAAAREAAWAAAGAAAWAAAWEAAWEAAWAAAWAAAREAAWAAAGAAAWEAVGEAAREAAGAAAREAAGAAAWAAAGEAAREAAGEAAWAAAGEAAREAAYVRMADKLVEIIKGVK